LGPYRPHKPAKVRGVSSERVDSMGNQHMVRRFLILNHMVEIRSSCEQGSDPQVLANQGRTKS
jgi:hypothetical protein